MNPLQSITTSLAFFLSNTFEESEPDAMTVKADWEPQPMTRVLYFHAETQTYRSATFVAIWNDFRNLRSELDTRQDEHFEASPYHHECQPDNMIIRARLIDDVSEQSDYVDVGLIVPATLENIAYAFGENQAVA
jgi:hypothetical protein